MTILLIDTQRQLGLLKAAAAICGLYGVSQEKSPAFLAVTLESIV